MRTAFFDSQLLGALGAGIAQVVLIGAGYDGRAFRFRTPGAMFYEVDRPATQLDKRRRLTDLGIAADGIRYVPLDLECERLEGRLARAGHLGGRPTLFVCEGLLLYLSTTAIDVLFEGISAAAARGSRLALSAREATPERRALSRAGSVISSRVLAAAGEPLRSTFRADDLRGLIEEGGFELRREIILESRRRDRRTLLMAAEAQ
jgi:methyltransferase (TIGR00027 family)